MPESEEEKKKRWAAAAAKSYMTPSMTHALNMSKQQSQNKYKEEFSKTKAKGYTPVASTPEIENAKKQSKLISQNKYKSEFEKNKAKFTQVADDPETVRVSRVSNQISNVAYHGKGSAVSKSKRRKNPTETTSQKTVQVPSENICRVDNTETHDQGPIHKEEEESADIKLSDQPIDSSEKEESTECESPSHNDATEEISIQRDITEDKVDDVVELQQYEETEEAVEDFNTNHNDDDVQEPDQNSDPVEENVYDQAEFSEIPDDAVAESVPESGEYEQAITQVPPEEAIYSEPTEMGEGDLDDFYANLG